MKRIMAVCDVDPFYADRFAEYANRKEKTPFTAVAFSSLARLREFAAKKQIEMLLVSDGVKPEDLEGIEAGQVVRLCEQADMVPEEAAVYKYQSSEEVLREVMACYRVQPEYAMYGGGAKKSTVIGVYSPVSRCGKTGFALVLGQVLAKEASALYLSLEEYSGLSRLLKTPHTVTLSDLIYYCRQEGYSRMRLGSVVYSWGGLDYVPPAAYAEDLEEVSGKELAELTAQIAADGAYDTVVVDLGHLTHGKSEILELCDVIYVPVREDCVSAAKLEEWRATLERSNRMHLWEHVRMLKLPAAPAVVSAESYLEQLVWGELGDFVRGLLKGSKGGLYS